MKRWRYLWAVVVTVLMAGAVAPAGADDPQTSQKPKQSAPKSLSIEVTSATYGHGTMHSSCIVTPMVKRSCNGRSRCVVKVEDELCPPPSTVPAGLILTLTVEYKCTPLATGHTIRADKPFQVVIDCGGAAAQFSPKLGSVP
jgi:hypothetical protein